jgi:hypothetical protein
MGKYKGEKMKIVVMPGVGFQSASQKYDDFCAYLKNNLNCEAEMFFWKHSWPLPSDITLPCRDTRLWTYEVILDFQQVLNYCFEMKLPEADYYIGHSAGSILALAQENKSCITFGSPAILIECLHESENTRANEMNTSVRLYNMIKTKRNVYNIINEYDLLAYYIDLPNVENFTYEGPWYNPRTYEPLECHLGYWEDDIVREKIVETIKKWESI